MSQAPEAPTINNSQIDTQDVRNNGDNGGEYHA